MKKQSVFFGIAAAALLCTGCVTASAQANSGGNAPRGANGQTPARPDEVFVTGLGDVTIKCLAYNPGGSYFAAGFSNGLLQIFDASTGRLFRTLSGHNSQINSMSWSPDGHRIVSNSADGINKVWDAGTGRELLSFPGIEGSDSPISFSPNGRLIVHYRSYPYFSRIWDAETGRNLFSRNWVGSIEIVFSPDSRRFISISGRELSVWDAETFQEQPLRGHNAWVNSAEFSPDGRYVVSSAGDSETENTVKVWDLQTGRERFTVHCNGLARMVKYSPDGRRVAALDGNRIRILDAETGRELLSFQKDVSWGEWISLIAYSPDGRRIVSGTSKGAVSVWVANTGQESFSFNLDRDITNVAFSPDSRRVIVEAVMSGGGRNEKNAVTVWDAESGMELLSVNPLDRLGRDLDVRAWSPGYRRLIVNRGGIKAWDAETGRELWTVTKQTGSAFFAVYSPDSRRIAAGSADTALMVLDAGTGQVLQTLPGFPGISPKTVYSMAYSPNGQNIIAGSSVAHAFLIWNPDSGQRPLVKRHNQSNNIGEISVAYRPDGRRFVSGAGDGTVKIWDAESGQELLAIQAHNRDVNSLAYSPDGRRIISGSDTGRGNIHRSGTGSDVDIGIIKVWDAESGQELRTLQGHGNYVYSVAYSPDGRHIISVANNRTVKIWDAESGQELRTLQGHSGSVRSVSYSPDGKHIVSGSADRTVKIWDAGTGRELRTLQGHSGSVRSVSYSPDGHRIISASDDGTVRIWNAESGEEAARFVTFTDGEWVWITPQGYYTASPNGDQYLNVRIGSTVTGIDAYRAAFNRPDLVAQALAGN